MFEIDRTFSEYSAKTGLTQWYFNAREGVFGPYATKQKAAEALKSFIEKQIRLKDDGGRSSGKKVTKLSLIPIELDSSHKKRNDDMDL